MFLLALFLALSSVAAWAVAITIPAVACGRILAIALVRLIKGR